MAIITSDNPRTESPEKIIADIVAGVAESAQNYQIVTDRRSAIRCAMELARRDDIIVLAGKGHETYQQIGTEKHHLDEREEVADCLAQMRR